MSIPVPTDLIDRLVADVTRAVTVADVDATLHQIGPALVEKLALRVRRGAEALYLEGVGAGLRRAAEIQLNSGKVLADLVREGNA